MFKCIFRALWPVLCSCLVKPYCTLLGRRTSSQPYDNPFLLTPLLHNPPPTHTHASNSVSKYKNKLSYQNSKPNGSTIRVFRTQRPAPVWISKCWHNKYMCKTWNRESFVTEHMYMNLVKKKFNKIYISVITYSVSRIIKL